MPGGVCPVWRAGLPPVPGPRCLLPAGWGLRSSQAAACGGSLQAQPSAFPHPLLLVSLRSARCSMFCYFYGLISRGALVEFLFYFIMHRPILTCALRGEDFHKQSLLGGVSLKSAALDFVVLHRSETGNSQVCCLKKSPGF